MTPFLSLRLSPNILAEGDSRPPLPNNSRFNTQGLQDLLRACWSTKPTQRPTFSKIVNDLKQLRKSTGRESVDSPRIPVIDEESEPTTFPSPDMRPTMPEHLQVADNYLCELFSSPIFSLSLLTCKKADDVLPNIFRDPEQISSSSDVPHSESHSESTVSTEDMKKPELVIYTPATSSRSSSIMPATSSEYPNVIDYDGYDSPPLDERVAKAWNERRYRLLLTHEYHPSRRSILQIVLESSYSCCFF